MQNFYLKSLLSGVPNWQKACKSQNEDIVTAHCINQHEYAYIRIFYISKTVLHCTLEVRYLEVMNFNVWFAYAKVLWVKRCLLCKAHRSIAKSSEKNVQEKRWCVIILHISASSILFMGTCASLYWTFKCLNGVNNLNV